MQIMERLVIMRKLLAFFVLLIPFYSISAMAKTGVAIEVGTDDSDDGTVEEVWVGPGFYYGYWFDDEDSYHRHHGGRGHRGHGDRHADGRRHDGRGDRHDGGHGGGGRHGGGGHGGGGHGGGRR